MSPTKKAKRNLYAEAEWKCSLNPRGLEEASGDDTPWARAQYDDSGWAGTKLPIAHEVSLAQASDGASSDAGQLFLRKIFTLDVIPAKPVFKIVIGRRDSKQRRKVLYSALLGNALEFRD